MGSFTLYSYWRSSASYRVRIAMNLKGLRYEYRAVHLLKDGGEQNKESYRALNPIRQVPTLVHDGQALSQSVAILDYLDAIAPQPRLFPQDPYLRARVLQACEIVNSGIQPYLNVPVLAELEKNAAYDQDKKNRWGAKWIESGMKALDELLSASAGRFSFGDQVTAADCFVVPQVFSAARFGADLSALATIQRINSNCLQMTAFQDASPEKQPDYA